MTGRNWTELFFLDEAAAFAAGHRPCGYCRRDAYRAYVDAWKAATGAPASAKEMDKVLHPARVRRDRSQVRYQAALDILPDGTFIQLDDAPHLIWKAALHRYTPDRYEPPIPPKAAATVTVLTPKPTVAVLKAGYVPQVALPKAPKA